MIHQLLACSLLAALSINRVLAAVHVVNVGNGGFRYDPQVTNASRGDIVTFKFFPTNHSVYRAVYTESPTCPGGYCNPCVPSNIYFPAENDFFFSTLILGDISNPPEWNLTINDTQPIFFSCNAPGSCQPNGMVGVINPNSSTSISKQEAAAKNAQYQLSPGAEFPSESAPTAPASSTAATSQPTSSPSNSSSGGSQSNNSSGSSSSSSHHGLSKGAIAGIAVGSVVAVALFGALIFYYAKSRAYSHIFSASQGKGGEDSGVSTSSAPGGGGGAGGGMVGAWLASQQQHQREKLGMDAEAQAQRGSYQATSTGVSSPRPTAPGSPTPEQGAQFVGYNRLSGNEEYAFEADAGIDNQINEMRTPPMRPGSWSRDAKMPSPGPGGRIELP